MISITGMLMLSTKEQLFFSPSRWINSAQPHPQKIMAAESSGRSYKSPFGGNAI